MATAQKTYRGDLTGAIAGVLWSRIKEANTKKELEKSNASDDIKEAAVELRKEDPSDKSIPVQDKSLSCLLYTSPSPRDNTTSRMPSSA